MTTAKEPRIIGIVSAKGGVGKTTTAVNLGASFINHFGKMTLLLDTNLTTGNLGLHLGFSYPQPSLHDVLRYKMSLLNSIYTHNSGLHVIPSSLTTKEQFYNPAVLKKRLKQLAGHYDMILLDSAPGLGSETKAAMRIADELLVVASPDFPALGTVAKTIEIAKQLNTPVRGIILNRVKGKGYELKKHDVEGCMELPVLSIIPDDEKINESIAARMPVVLYNPKSPSSKAFRKLSASILGEDVPESPGLWDRIRNLFP